MEKVVIIIRIFLGTWRKRNENLAGTENLLVIKMVSYAAVKNLSLNQFILAGHIMRIFSFFYN